MYIHTYIHAYIHAYMHTPGQLLYGCMHSFFILFHRRPCFSSLLRGSQPIVRLWTPMHKKNSFRTLSGTSDVYWRVVWRCTECEPSWHDRIRLCSTTCAMCCCLKTRLSCLASLIYATRKGAESATMSYNIQTRINFFSSVHRYVSQWSSKRTALSTEWPHFKRTTRLAKPPSRYYWQHWRCCWLGIQLPTFKFGIRLCRRYVI